MMELYTFAPRDRSGKIRWLLEELNVSYKLHELDPETGENETPEYLKLNPLGRVPTLMDSGQAIHESGAICIYLTDKYSDKRLAPPPASPCRGQYLQWIFFAVATLDPALIELFENDGLSEQEKKAKHQRIVEDFAPMAAALEAALHGHDYLVGGEFSAADIMVAQPLYWANRFQLLDPYSKLSQYLNRLSSREACRQSRIFVR